MRLFTPTKEQFELLYEGFMMGGNIVQQKGFAVMRREIAILDKFESISKDCECGRLITGTKETAREYVSGELELDDKEFDLIWSYISLVPWSTGKSVRNAVATLQALKNVGK